MMIFDRELVELYLREKFWGDRLAEESRKEKARELQTFVEQRVRSIQSAPSAGKTGAIRGKGGRRKTA